MNELPIWVNEIETQDETKAIFRPSTEAVLHRIPIECLRASLDSVCHGLESALSGVKEVGNFRLREVTVRVEVTAAGGINLIGTASIGGGGAIKLTFSEKNA